MSGYWRSATTVAVLVLATVGIRAHESIPYQYVLHPAAVIAYIGGFFILLNSSIGVIWRALVDRLTVLLGAYFAWALVTAPFALWPQLALTTVRVAPATAAMVIAVLACRPVRPALSKVVWGFCLAAAVLGFGSLLRARYLIDGAGLRLSTVGLFDPNDLAAVMDIAFPFALGLLLRERGAKRLLAVCLAVLYAVVVVRTASRGGTLALVVGVLVFAFTVRGKSKVLLVVALTIAPIVTWSLAPEPFRARMHTMVDMDQDYNYTFYTGRKQVWARARRYIFEHPVAGVGAGNFPIAEGESAAALGRPTKWSAAHNAYLQAFAELGVVGGAIYLAILVTAASRAWPMWRRRRGAPRDMQRPEYLAALAAFAISAYFLSHAYFYPLFALCAVITLAHRTLVKEAGFARPARHTWSRYTGW